MTTWPLVVLLLLCVLGALAAPGEIDAGFAAAGMGSVFSATSAFNVFMGITHTNDTIVVCGWSSFGGTRLLALYSLAGEPGMALPSTVSGGWFGCVALGSTVFVAGFDGTSAAPTPLVVRYTVSSSTLAPQQDYSIPDTAAGWWRAIALAPGSVDLAIVVGAVGAVNSTQALMWFNMRTGAVVLRRTLGVGELSGVVSLVGHIRCGACIPCGQVGVVPVLVGQSPASYLFQVVSRAVDWISWRN